MRSLRSKYVVRVHTYSTAHQWSYDAHTFEWTTWTERTDNNTNPDILSIEIRRSSTNIVHRHNNINCSKTKATTLHAHGVCLCVFVCKYYKTLIISINYLFRFKLVLHQNFDNIASFQSKTVTKARIRKIKSVNDDKILNLMNYFDVNLWGCILISVFIDSMQKKTMSCGISLIFNLAFVRRCYSLLLLPTRTTKNSIQLHIA